MGHVQLLRVIACGVVVISGCGQVTMKDDPNVITIDEAPLEMARTICLRAYDCCAPMQLMPNMSAGTDEATCETESTVLFRNQLSTVANSEKKGRLIYNGDKLAACLTRIRNTSCEDLNRTNHLSGVDCGEPYLEAQVAPGGACGLDAECVRGTCDKAEGAAEGTCVGLARVNQSCADGSLCGDHLYCDGADQLCKPTQPDGTACSAGKQCASGSCNKAAGVASCGPSGANMCFYSSSCSAAGPATPSLTALLVGLLTVVLMARRRARIMNARRKP